MNEAKLERELSTLDELSLDELRDKWRRLKDRPVPRVSAALLRQALGWELQAAIHGGLSRRAQQKLEQIAAGQTQTQNLVPGMRLAREWNGTLHVVTIAEDGSIRWNERTWKSLSAVARAITGTRWSGPAFFGLKQKAKAA